MDLSDDAITWLSNYLKNRYQITKIGGHSSSTMQIKMGVPQGSILGPLLFLVYINDFPLNTSYNTIMYADDISIFFLFNSKNIDYAAMNNTINYNVNNIFKYFKHNELIVNTAKTNFLIFHNNNIKIDYSKIMLKLDDNQLEHKNSIKFLGINFDNKLTFKERIIKLNKDLSKCIATLYKLKTLIPKNNLMNVYKAIFQSKLNYCNNIWASTYNNRTTKLQKLQNKAIRICLNLKQTDHIDYNKQNILDIKSLTIYQFIIYMYKHKHNLLHSTLANIFILNSDNNNNSRNLRSVNN